MHIIPLPRSPVERLTVKFRDVLHMPDSGPLYILLGAVAANLIEGPPVWLMLVGPPSCGKSELLNSLLGIPHIVEGADFSGEAAFLSGTATKDRAKNATGGLLCQIGVHGGLVLNDFTSVISKPQDKISQIMAVFREAYGGRWTRLIGGEGGRSLTWAGKLALFAGVTSRIDQHHQMSAELGERWIYYRFEPRQDNCFHECMMALSDNRPRDWRETLAGHVRDFVDDLGLGFRKQVPRRAFTDPERIHIHELAVMGVRCRSGVTRDGYSKEIISGRESELSTRLASILGQLLVGMDVIGVPEHARWKLLAKIAMDSMPRMRKTVIETAAVAPLTISALTEVIGCSLSVAKRVVEDLEVHEIVERDHGKVILTSWMETTYRKLTRLGSNVDVETIQ